MSVAGSGTNRGDREPTDEKQDRQLIELLNELRLALPGVQMLLGFMLVAPFSQRFSSMTDNQRGLFYAGFIAAALATACFITPASFHRIIWEHGMKGRMLHIASGIAIAGTVLLAVAISCVVAVLTSFLYSSVAAIAATSAVGAVIAILWFGIPLVLREQHHHR
jgi:hypothetical protein